MFRVEVISVLLLVSVGACSTEDEESGSIESTGSLALGVIDVGADDINCDGFSVDNARIEISPGVDGGVDEYTVSAVADQIDLGGPYDAPIGDRIAVTVELRTAANQVLFSGTQLVTIVGGATTPVNLTLQRNRTFCADPGGGVDISVAIGDGAFNEDLQVHFKFDDTRSTTFTTSPALDSYINQLDGFYAGQVTNVASGGLTYADFNLDCSFGCPTSFPSLNIPGDALDGTGARNSTISVWVNLGNVAAGSAPAAMFLIDGDSISFTPAFRVQLDESSTDGVYDSVTVTVFSLTSTVPLAAGDELSVDDGTWRHLVVTREDVSGGGLAGRWTVYIDGFESGIAEETEDVSTPRLADGANIIVGHPYDDTTNQEARFSGLMDELKIWNRVLSSSEINSEYLVEAAAHGQ